MGISRAQIPDIYYCEECDPRPVDQYSAIRLQTRKSKLCKLTSQMSANNDDVINYLPQMFAHFSLFSRNFIYLSLIILIMCFLYATA